MQLAEATAEIVRAEREWAAAVVDRVKAEKYEGECWRRVLQARAAGREAINDAVSAS